MAQKPTCLFGFGFGDAGVLPGQGSGTGGGARGVWVYLVWHQVQGTGPTVLGDAKWWLPVYGHPKIPPGDPLGWPLGLPGGEPRGGPLGPPPWEAQIVSGRGTKGYQ